VETRSIQLVARGSPMVQSKRSVPQNEICESRNLVFLLVSPSIIPDSIFHGIKISLGHELELDLEGIQKTSWLRLQLYCDTTLRDSCEGEEQFAHK